VLGLLLGEPRQRHAGALMHRADRLGATHPPQDLRLRRHVCPGGMTCVGMGNTAAARWLLAPLTPPRWSDTWGVWGRRRTGGIDS
jgi:hypothetical protein